MRVEEFTSQEPFTGSTIIQPKRQEKREKLLLHRRILVVEDVKVNQILMSVNLTEAGAEVVLAGNGQVALDIITESEANNLLFDVILMDMQMPIMDGYEATSRLRKQGFNRPIIAITAQALSGDCEKTLKAGCTSYMTKPVNFENLIATILTLLDLYS
jgi:CheY-like chemotaxis protein